MSKKLQNIKAVKQLLDGSHRTQTRTKYYFGDAEKVGEKSKQRSVGERWIEERADGTKVYWEQKQGYKVRSLNSFEKQETLQKLRDSLKAFPNCRKEKCTCTNPERLDERFRLKMGMCFDCVTAMELELQMSGKFTKYAVQKMYNNVKSYFDEMDIQMEEWKRQMRGQFSVVNGDESMENWESSNSESTIKRMVEEYEEFKQELLKNYDPENAGD